MQADMQAGLSTRWLVLALIVLVLLRLVFTFAVSPFPDEAYYWLWGQRPDLSYFDHPPLQAWFQALVTGLFGQGLFTLRLPGLMSSAVILACLVWWQRRMQGPVLTAVVLAFASPLIFLFTAMVFNDHLMLALLSVATITAALTLDGFARSGRVAAGPMLATAILVGLAGLAKYNAVVFALGLIGLVLWHPAYRGILRSPWLYLAALAGLATLAPVFLWNLQHDAASFQYNLNDRIVAGADQGTVGSRIASFLVGFGLSVSPVFFVAMFRGLWRGPRLAAAVESDGLRLAQAAFLAALAFCMILSGFVPVLYYWGIVGIVAALPFLPVLIGSRLWQGVHLAYGLILSALIVFNSAVLPLSALGGQADEESGLLFGWPQITARVAAAQERTGATLVATSDYRHGAILAFWRDDAQVIVLSDRTSQFSLWLAEVPRQGQSAVILTDLWHPLAPAITRSFDSVTEIDRIPVMRFGRLMAEYRIYLGRGFKAGG